MATTNPSFDPPRPTPERPVLPHERVETSTTAVTPPVMREAVRPALQTRSKPDLKTLDQLDTAAFLLAAVMTLGPLAAYSFGWGA
ncbi:MAG: hypothetical protein U1E49_09090 [Hyphomicrobiaceae bacterium]